LNIFSSLKMSTSTFWRMSDVYCYSDVVYVCCAFKWRMESIGFVSQIRVNDGHLWFTSHSDVGEYSLGMHRNGFLVSTEPDRIRQPAEPNRTEPNRTNRIKWKYCLYFRAIIKLLHLVKFSLGHCLSGIEIKQVKLHLLSRLTELFMMGHLFSGVFAPGGRWCLPRSPIGALLRNQPSSA